MGGHSYRRELEAILARDGFVCGICGEELPSNLSKIHVRSHPPRL